jgi:negative regulator of sigma-B (phosphoserine phosphatase)
MLQIMEGLHRTMAGTRGAAGTVVLFREGKVEACAVGNVELRSGDLRLPLVATPGVLGVRVRKFRTCEAVVSRPGRAILFSDGISSRAPFLDFLRLGPGEFCEEILNSYRRDHDDSTVLAADVEPF